MPEEEEKEDLMSMTMQQKEMKEKTAKYETLRTQINQLQQKINMQKEIGEHIAGKTVIF